MTRPQPERHQPEPHPPDPSRPDPDQPGDPVGGLGKEAVKLLFALRDLAGDAADSVDSGVDSGADEAAGAAGTAGAAEAAASALRGAAASAQRLGDHLSAGSDSCRYCPVCQGISLVRATPPEVRHHLAAAGTSLLRAVSSLMATPVPDPSEPGPRPEPAEPQPNQAEDRADRATDDEWEDD